MSPEWLNALGTLIIAIGTAVLAVDAVRRKRMERQLAGSPRSEIAVPSPANGKESASHVVEEILATASELSKKHFRAYMATPFLAWGGVIIIALGIAVSFRNLLGGEESYAFGATLLGMAAAGVYVYLFIRHYERYLKRMPQAYIDRIQQLMRDPSFSPPAAKHLRAEIRARLPGQIPTFRLIDALIIEEFGDRLTPPSSETKPAAQARPLAVD